MKHLLHSLLALILATLSIASAAEQSPPRDVVMNAANGMAKQLLANKERVQKQDYYLEQLIDEQLLPVVDHVYMARLVLGKFWRRASSEQQRAFVEAFKHKVIRTYAGAFRAFDDQEMNFSEARLSPSGNRALVKSEIMRVGAPSIKVDYKLFSRDDQWQIYDVVIEGVSLVKSFSDQMSRSIEENGLAKAISILADEYKDQSPTVSLGTPDWGPYASNQQPDQGLAAAIVKRAFAQQGWQVDVDIRPQQAIDEAVTSKKLDGWLAQWRDNSPHTVQSAAFLSNHLVVVSRRDAGLTMAELLDSQQARSLKIGLFNNVAYNNEVTQFAAQFEQHYRDYCSHLFRDLAREELDLVIVDRWVAEQELASSDNIAKHLEILSPELANQDLHVTIRASLPNAQRMISAFNDGLQQLKQTGAYTELLQDFQYPHAPAD
ncbi:hypothetical protein CHH28_14165 [Bacterioplanes sanyensis]|uniref:ABC transporter substrate-binding protein n=1 Tax=Bacterioplanes sanyensis TaxID=1249553 RepID=A0A222FMC7_9GAMM|nr:ABC transporter substrate-binding protein [Bacterioplanes sanyensis]ASP39746.1 hypothetical protein CHH28_14165 [Bacterioplanes sanyensis]